MTPATWRDCPDCGAQHYSTLSTCRTCRYEIDGCWFVAMASLLAFMIGAVLGVWLR